MNLRAFLPLALAFAASCNSIGKGSCEKLVKEICDECDLDNDYYEDAVCGCINDGEVDNADDYFSNDEEAEIFCAELKNSVASSYVTNEEESDCRQQLDILQEFGGDACEYYGYETSGDGGDGYDGYDGYDGGSDGTDGSYYYYYER